MASRQLLPFRLMRFLDHAHQLGLLRVVGSAYQFRHAELQDHLAKIHHRHPTLDKYLSPIPPTPTWSWPHKMQP